MKVIISAATEPKVEDRNDFTSFSVVLPSDLDPTVADSCLAGLGHFDGEHVWVSIDRMRRALELDAEGERSFNRMIDYASSHGWTDEDGTTFRSHVVRD